MYALDLQVESEGDSLKTLEGLLTWEEHNLQPYIRISRPPRIDPSAPIERAKLRYPPVDATNARQVVQSLVPAEVKKDLYYRENPHDAMTNTLHTTESIKAKGYPNCWWDPLLLHRISKWGGPLH